jgi:hypothetical protein
MVKQRNVQKLRWRADEFKEHLLRIGNLVYLRNSVERALVCGVAMNEHLMLVIGQQLPALFGIQVRQLHAWLGRLGWETRRPGEIPDSEIMAAFGPDLANAANFYGKPVQYRTFTERPTYSTELDGPPEIPDPDPDADPTENPDEPPDIEEPTCENPLADPGASASHIEALKAIVEERTDRLVEYEQEFQIRLDQRTCEMREELRSREETIEELKGELFECSQEFERELDRRTIELNEELIRAGDAVTQLGARLEASEAGRDKLIGTLMHENESLNARIWDQFSQIRALNSRIKALERLIPNPPKRQAQPIDDPESIPSTAPEISDDQKRVLYMFYHGQDLAGLSACTGLAEREVFRVVQSLIVPPIVQLPDTISLPSDWALDRRRLATTTTESSFLFSPTLRQTFDQCRNVDDFAGRLARAFEDFSWQEQPDWRPMAIFVMDMIVNNVVRGVKHPSPDVLQHRIDVLMSQKGQLMRKCRARKDEMRDYQSDVRVRASHAEAAHRRELAERDDGLVDMDTVVSSASPVRAEVFREMVYQAQDQGRRHYSDNLYHAAVILMFRSRSGYEVLTDLAHLPAPPSIYAHFKERIDECKARFKSLDEVEPYLLSQIARCPDIANGAVVAVDAISCTNTFVGMKHIEKSKAAYLFVAYFQPLTPKAKCSPLFLLESQSGLADGDLQKEIDKILLVTQNCIKRVFIASDGDPSYNIRHNVFMEFWDPIFRSEGLDAVLLALKLYTGTLPLSDLLHLAKNFRGRFLKYFLTFSNGKASKSTSLKIMREILELGSPLTDLSQVGKMKDAYPLVITRVDHMNMLFQRGAVAEAVAWLPLSLCFNAIRLENITRETRTFMLRISFFMVWHLYERKRLKLDKNPQMSRKKKKTVKLTIFTTQWSVSFLDTSLLIIFSIENYEFIALDRESTHPLENFFGYVRMDGDDVNTPEQMTTTISHTDIVKEAMLALEMPDVVHGRDNIAGVHLTNKAPAKKVYDIALTTPMDPEEIAKILLNSVHGNLTPEEQLGFQQFRHYMTLLETPARESRINGEINQRFLVGSGTRIVRLLAVHNKSVTPKNGVRST